MLFVVPRRTTLPVAQRNPSPNAVPAPCVVPWKYRTFELAVMPLPTSVSVSKATLGRPLLESCAPLVFCEFAQPRPAPPLLPHGQLPPKQYATPPWQASAIPSPFMGALAFAAFLMTGTPHNSGEEIDGVAVGRKPEGEGMGV